MTRAPFAHRAVAWLSCAAISALAAYARADRAVVNLANGSQVSGELVEYVPGDHVSVQVSEGAPLRFPAAEVSSVELVATQPAGSVPAEGVPAGAAPAYEPSYAQGLLASPPGTATVDQRTQLLLMRRAQLLARPIGVGLPMTLTIAGGIFAVLGLGVMLPTALIDCNRGDDTGTCRDDAVTGGLTGGFGLAAAVAGSFWLRSRYESRRERDDELRAIDAELRGAPMAQLTPWFTGAHGGAGLRLTLAF